MARLTYPTSSVVNGQLEARMMKKFGEGFGGQRLTSMDDKLASVVHELAELPEKIARALKDALL